MKRTMVFVNELAKLKSELIDSIKTGVALFLDKYEIPRIDLGEMDAKVLYEADEDDGDAYIQYLNPTCWELEDHIKPFWLRTANYGDLDMNQLLEIMTAVEKLLDMHKGEITVSWE